MRIQNMALLIVQHFLDDHQYPIPASSFDKTTPSRKRPSDRSTTSITDTIAVKRPLLSVETSADVKVNADVAPHLDIFNTVSSSQSSGRLYVADSPQTDSYNPLLSRVYSKK